MALITELAVLALFLSSARKLTSVAAFDIADYHLAGRTRRVFAVACNDDSYMYPMTG
jgi:hypothetical protein